LKRRAEKKGMIVLCVTARGLKLSKGIAKASMGAKVVSPDEIRAAGIRKKAAEAFKSSSAVVFISATGIAVRAIAPLVKAKHLDPAVVVVDERGQFSISLLSGHLGGANSLAKDIAAATGALPVITTATDIWGLPCVEDISREFGLHIEDPKKIKAANAAILEGSRVYVVDGNSARLKSIKARFNQRPFVFRKSVPGRLKAGEAVVLITSGAEKPPKEISSRTLVMRPKEVVAGIGCRRGATKEDIRKALTRAMKAASLSPGSLRCIATIDLKKDEKGLRDLAEDLGLDIRFFKGARLRKAGCESTPSAFVEKITGAGGVAEPAALLASGAERLCLKKIKSTRVTVALARAPFMSSE